MDDQSSLFDSSKKAVGFFKIGCYEDNDKELRQRLWNTLNLTRMF